MGNIDQSVINAAEALNKAGEVEQAYQVLANAGDRYASWAVGIIGDDGGFQANVLQGSVRALWESQIPGSTRYFDAVALQHQANYILMLDVNSGRLPTTYDIETSYVSALHAYGLPPSLSIDVVLNTAPNGIGAGVWWLSGHFTDFNGAEWYEALGLEAERITPDQKLIVDGMSPSEAYGLFFASIIEGIGGGPTESRYIALTIRDAARAFSINNSLNINVDDSGFLAKIERFVELSKEAGLWDENTGALIVEALQTIEGSDLDIQPAVGLTLFESILAAAINGNQAQFDVYKRIFEANEMCFLAGTQIDMWPLDANLQHNADDAYNESIIRARIWQKPIEDITPDDVVVSHDKAGRLQPGVVTRTFQNDAKIVLDFFGTGVTPGHVYYRADSTKPDPYATLIDVLRDDGVIETSDGVQIRAATGLPIDDERDGFVWAVTGARNADGRVDVLQKGKLRLGTRFITDEGKDICIADLIKVVGGAITDNELIQVGEGGPQVPFHWTFSDQLPKPEDYILQRSGTNLEAIYRVNEWESRGPFLPAPLLQNGERVKPSSGVELSLMDRNTPLAMQEGNDGQSFPTLNRKQRKAMAAKQRKAFKSKQSPVLN